MLCVEQFPTTQRNHAIGNLIHQRLGSVRRTSPELRIAKFETVSASVDFCYSVDVLEHVDDVRGVMRHHAKILRPGGVGVHAVDFSGHNAFAGTDIDFLTCPDWAWNLMHSHLITSNRLRPSQVTGAALDAGLEVEQVVPTRTVTVERVEELRAKLNPRFANLPADELRILEAIVVLRAPATSGRGIN